MDDLFDVFDDQNAGGASAPRKTKKRQANGEPKAEDAPIATDAPDARTLAAENLADENTSIPPPTRGDKTKDTEEEAHNLQDASAAAARADQKRVKLDEPDAVVTDSYVAEQSKEIKADAGLGTEALASATINVSYQVRHQTALPPNYDNYIPLNQHVPNAVPAKEYKFELDSFQKYATHAIERNESVLVSAHTSAGKTVVAEYAIAQCLKGGSRVIYTSPIKALSNQKFREFTAEFADVGLMTGDVTINPSASCLVMTTEILRSMLYRGSEVMREVGWVVFDEVHYLRDKERGVVWEETMILLPDRVRYVFLSATIPNAMQFAEWIAKEHNQPCHVVYTDYRPTPLQQYMFPAGADGIHLVVDEKAVFKEDAFSKVMSMVNANRGAAANDPNARQRGKGKDKRNWKGGNKQQQGPSDMFKIVRMLMHKEFNPIISFSFSKRECENNAIQLKGLSFNDQAEGAMVRKIYNNAMDNLSEDDRKLPQIEAMLPLLARGIAVHHGGLLPILKETIEILFQEGLVKVLFATETFSIGLNMPAKTVVFTSVRKFDGQSMRFLTPSEFIQMSGRAGRRGIDSRGIVIMMVDDVLDPTSAKSIVRGEQDRMNSQFRLGYNMVLNLLRVEGFSPEYMIEHSFFQFQNVASIAHLEKKQRYLEDERESLFIEDEAMVKNYYDLRMQIDQYTKDMKEVMTHPQYCLQYMQTGRLIKVKLEDHEFGWGIVINFTERRPDRSHRGPKPEYKPQEAYVVDVLLPVAAGAIVPDRYHEVLPSDIRPPQAGEKTQFEVVPILLTCVDAIGHIKIFLPDSLSTPEDRNSCRKRLDEVKRRFPDGIPLLDPVENMGIHDESFKKLLRKIEVLEARMLGSPLHESARLPDLYQEYKHKLALSTKIKEIKTEIRDAQSLVQLDELKSRKRLLRRLGFINEQDVVQLKARVACEISTGDELVLAELLLDRFFNELTPHQCAAILSSFIFEEKSKNPPKIADDLMKAFREVQAHARTVARVAQECKLAVNEEEYMAKFKPELMEVVFAWCNGRTFAEICKMTDIYEGSLIRLFRRLEELVRQMVLASRVMGSEELAEKFEECLKLLIRDLVATQSLYL